MIQNGKIYRMEGSLEDDKYYKVHYNEKDNEFFKKSDGIDSDPLIVVAEQSSRNLTDFGFQFENQNQYLYYNDAGLLTLGDEICYFGIEEIRDDIYNIMMPASTIGGYLTMETLLPIQFSMARNPPKQKWKFIGSTIDPDKVP